MRQSCKQAVDGGFCIGQGLLNECRGSIGRRQDAAVPRVNISGMPFNFQVCGYVDRIQSISVPDCVSGGAGASGMFQHCVCAEEEYLILRNNASRTCNMAHLQRLLYGCETKSARGFRT